MDDRAVFAALSAPYVLLTPGLVIVDANAAYLASTGRSRGDLVGQFLYDAFPPGPGGSTGEITAAMGRVRDTGRSQVMPLLRYDITDTVSGVLTERYWLLSGDPVLGPSGRVELILQRAEDVTDLVRERTSGQLAAEQDDAHRRRVATVEADLFARAQELTAALAAKDVAAAQVAALNEVALRLTAAQSLAEVERTVVGHGLGALGADGGAVVSHHPDGGWRATIAPEAERRMHGAYTRVPDDSPLPGAWSARSGRRLLLPTVAAGLAFDPVMASVYETTRHRGWALLPLTVRGRRLGCLAASWTAEHEVDAAELALLEGLAAQCAQALDRIEIARAQRASARAVRQMSETLQRSLLTQPAVRGGLHIAVRYRPAAEQAHVGGDWHDAFVTQAGATLVVIGDIAGHDRAAAAAMGQVRNLLRGIAYDSDDGPAVLLTRLDRAIAGLELETLATAVLARVEQDGADRLTGSCLLRWATAGHLPPLLRRPDGTVQVLQAKPDLLLGLDPDTARAEQCVRLTPGSTLVLYTDGLVERRGSDLDEGVARLAGVLAGRGDALPEPLCDLLLAAMGTDRNQDDTALLVLRVG